MMNQSQRREFVEKHRTCIFGFQRKHCLRRCRSSTTSWDGDDLLISTMAERAKAKAIRRTREAAICVLDEKWPLTYLQIYGPAAVEDYLQTTVDVMMKVAAIMSGQPLPEAARPIVEAKAREEHRVVFRLQPQWSVHT